jgi:hypothetical protein
MSEPQAFYSWQVAYRLAVFETDAIKVRERVNVALMAIEERFRDVVRIDEVENLAIDSARMGLASIRIERLKRPTFIISLTNEPDQSEG